MGRRRHGRRAPQLSEAVGERQHENSMYDNNYMSNLHILTCCGCRIHGLKQIARAHKFLLHKEGSKAFRALQGLKMLQVLTNTRKLLPSGYKY